MKAKITITGGISGNFCLARKMHNYTHKKDSMFNSFHFYYNSVQEAKADMKEAYKGLKIDLWPEHKNILRRASDYSRISYDASTAQIFKANE